jgi:hypothetical protein
MINPLSLQLGQIISGKEINDWCEFQIETDGSHVKDAFRLKWKYYRNDRLYKKIYKIETGHPWQGCQILFERVDK